MAFWQHFMQGLASSLSVSATPLYRYPYRNGAEAFRGDMQRVAGDISNVMDKLNEQQPK